MDAIAGYGLPSYSPNGSLIAVTAGDPLANVPTMWYPE